MSDGERRAQPGYYPGFSTLAQQDAWDDATRALVRERVENVPPLRFFDEPSARFWTCVFDHLIPQSDRAPERRVAILNVVDERLYRDRTAGYRYADMPPDREAYHLGREAIDREARAEHGSAFLDLSFAQQDVLLKRIHDGAPLAAPEIWEAMPVHRFWQLLMGDAAEAYYAHPWAWDEIGFGGPAYPRGYTRLERGQPEPWEVAERRYEWAAPADAVSDQLENVHEFSLESEQHRAHAAGLRSK